MQKVQRSGDSVWSLPARESITLQVGPGARVVQVCEGRLWLTSAGTADEASMDVWLVPGDSLELPAGLAVVMEAWPSARFQLLVPRQACRSTGRTRSMLASLATWVERQFDGHAGAELQPSGH
ncbi:MAG: DUF2917 domain-containing protein [Caldimonas sp.]